MRMINFEICFSRKQSVLRKNLFYIFYLFLHIERSPVDYLVLSSLELFMFEYI